MYYLYDFSYGNMINRINIEAHHILTREKKFYFYQLADLEKIIDDQKD
jgi:hypothetical protein